MVMTIEEKTTLYSIPLWGLHYGASVNDTGKHLIFQNNIRERDRAQIWLIVIRSLS